ncbi:transposase [Bradyrhizobium sp. CSS354]|uniref:IS110 family transposase n=1 Tax=Bradyrhizobium sp. CSS354 TaxID=2699172 RepID=UPI0023B02066|nr:transposase [Bradyrhizobium sp. CSS354]
MQGRIDLTRTALDEFGKTLLASDEVVVEATTNSMAVSRVLAPLAARAIVANPLQVKVIAQARVKTDKIDAGTLASLQASGYMPQIWTPDAETERKRRLVGRRYQVMRHRTRLKNEVHSILHAHLIPKCPDADLSTPAGRAWLAAQQLLDDQRTTIYRHIRELDRLAGRPGPARPRDRAVGAPGTGRQQVPCNATFKHSQQYATGVDLPMPTTSRRCATSRR